jgi:colanic acid biosynthesis glycosyl transferase WcaI
VRVLVIGLNYLPELTGIAPYTSGLCKGLAARGEVVCVLTTMPHYPEWRIRAGYNGARRHEWLDGVSVTRLRHYVPARPTGVRRLLSEISFGLRAVLSGWGHPDLAVFVSPALFSTAIGMARALLLGIPTVIWVQDVYSLGMTETRGKTATGRVARAIASIESAVLMKATGVAVIHDRLKPVVERLGVSSERVEVVRNWTHLRPDAPMPRDEVRSRLSWSDDETVVLHTGAIGRKQDLDTVVSAARIADAKGAKVRFVLMGDGGERSRLEAAARGVHSISFLDPQSDDMFQGALAAADVLLVNEHAGLREMAVPSKLTSYFSSGRPVLAATDVDSVTAGEIEASGGGVRIDAGRPELLVDAALRLGRDTVQANRLGSAGRRYQRSVLAESAAIDRFEAWLKGIPKRRRRIRRFVTTLGQREPPSD